MATLLADLLSHVQILAPSPPLPSLEVTGICDHSARVRQNNIFVAIRGYELDGHDFIGQAIAKGAIAVIAERKVTAGVPIFIVPNSRIALAQLSKAWFGNPSESLKMIGVTASNGKTTTVFMVDSILSSQYPVTGLIGTVVVKDGKTTVGAELTTPNSLALYEILARMQANRCTHVTMEVSSAAQELERTHGIAYDIVTFNNVTREHVDFHGSFEKYWHHKAKLVQNLPPTATTVLNADEPSILALSRQTQADYISYSLKGNPAPIQVRDIDLNSGSGSFRYVIAEKYQSSNFSLLPCDLTINQKVLGLHNIYNAAVAITVAKLCGVSDSKICTALAGFSGVERRFQLIYDKDFRIIDDHFANTGNIDITMATLGLMKYNRLHLLIAIRGGRGAVVNRENTETLVKWLPLLAVAELILTDSNDFTGTHDQVTSEERTAVFDTLNLAGAKYRHFPRLSDAIAAVLSSAQPGDVVLMGGCQGLDHGAHIAIPLLAQRSLPHERSSILKVLSNRFAGSS